MGDALTGDTQALAPATEEQAAKATAPQAGGEGAGEDEPMAEDAQEEAPPPAHEEALSEDQVPIASSVRIDRHGSGMHYPGVHILTQGIETVWCRHHVGI